MHRHSIGNGLPEFHRTFFSLQSISSTQTHTLTRSFTSPYAISCIAHIFFILHRVCKTLRPAMKGERKQEHDIEMHLAKKMNKFDLYWLACLLLLLIQFLPFSYVFGFNLVFFWLFVSNSSLYTWIGLLFSFACIRAGFRGFRVGRTSCLASIANGMP